MIELRRDADGGRDWAGEPGEYYMSFTGEYGGLWRRNGRPPQALAGVGFVGQDAPLYKNLLVADMLQLARRLNQSWDARRAVDRIAGRFGTDTVRPAALVRRGEAGHTPSTAGQP